MKKNQQEHLWLFQLGDKPSAEINAEDLFFSNGLINILSVFDNDSETVLESHDLHFMKLIYENPCDRC